MSGGTKPRAVALRARLAVLARVCVMACVASACLPTGHVDTAPGLTFASAGGGDAMWCGLTPRRSLPGATGISPVSGGEARARATRVEAGCMNATMRVVAYRGEGGRLVAARRWDGAVRWRGAIADGGSEYIGDIDPGGATRAASGLAIRWRGAVPAGIRVDTDEHGRGGVTLARWVPAGAVRVVVVVRHGYATGDGVARAGGSGSDRVAAPAGGFADGDGAGRGRGAPGRDGLGASASGTRAGSPDGGERPSWVQPASAEVSRRGGRTPEPGGARGGSPGGGGRPGDAGLTAGIAVFGVITVPASVAAVLELAVIMGDGGLSPAALASKWIRRGLGLGVARLRRAIEKDAAEIAALELRALRPRLDAGEFGRLPVAEQRRVLDATGEAIAREYFARVQRGAAREIENLRGQLARGVSHPWNEKLLRENLESAVRVRRAAKLAGDGYQPRVRPARPSVEFSWVGAADFERSLVRLAPAERVAKVESTARELARARGWRRDNRLSQRNNRTVYREPRGNNLYVVDTQHGRLEVIHGRTGRHRGEVDFDLNPTKPLDPSGGHDIAVR